MPFYLFAQLWEYKGLGTYDINSLYISNDTIYAGTGMNQASILYRSPNLGLSWDSITAVNVDNINIPSIISHEGSLFFGTHRNGLFRSTDNGISWELKDNGLPQEFAADVFAVSNNNYLIAAGSSGSSPGCIFWTNDNGENWSRISSGIPIEEQTSVLDIEINNAGHIYALADSWSGIKIWYSSNNAAIWYEISKPQSSANIGIGSLDLDSLGNLYFSSDDKIYFSSDNGTIWTPLFTFPAPVVKIKLNKKTGVMYVVAGDSIYSSGNGVNWINISNGLPANFTPRPTEQYLKMDFDLSNNVYLGTRAGVYKLPFPATSSTEIREKYLYFSFYPNPSNGEITISNLPGKNSFILNIYNLLGENCYNTIIDPIENRSLNLTGLTKGAYLLSLTNKEYRLRGRLLISTKE